MVVYQRLNKTSFLYYCVLLRGNLSRYAEIICGFSPALIKLMVCFEGFDLWELMMALLTLSAMVLSTWSCRQQYRPSYSILNI